MISTYTHMNNKIKDFLLHSKLNTCEYAAKRIEELERLADHVGFVDDAWYGCPGIRSVPCDQEATGAIIKEWPNKACHKCQGVPFKDFKFVRLVSFLKSRRTNLKSLNGTPYLRKDNGGME